jgi:hypothetical protein
MKDEGWDVDSTAISLSRPQDIKVELNRFPHFILDLSSFYHQVQPNCLEENESRTRELRDGSVTLALVRR